LDFSISISSFAICSRFLFSTKGFNNLPTTGISLIQSEASAFSPAKLNKNIAPIVIIDANIKIIIISKKVLPFLSFFILFSFFLPFLESALVLLSMAEPFEAVCFALLSDG
jgi:hypothetical protein